MEQPVDNSRLPFMVYGTLKQAYGNHAILRGNFDKMLPGSVDGYCLRAHRGAGFPYSEQKEGETLHGELYFVSEDVYASVSQRLDWLEGTPHHYHRELVMVHTEEGDFQANMYVATVDVSNLPIVEGGVWNRSW